MSVRYQSSDDYNDTIENLKDRAEDGQLDYEGTTILLLKEILSELQSIKEALNGGS